MKEKKVPVNKVWVALVPPPNLKAVKTKIVSWSITIHRPGENHVTIHIQKWDYSEIQAKVNTWRKV
jgi:hypothetical protein